MPPFGYETPPIPNNVEIPTPHLISPKPTCTQRASSREENVRSVQVYGASVYFQCPCLFAPIFSTSESRADRPKMSLIRMTRTAGWATNHG